MTTVYRTERLVLRVPVAGDAAGIARFYADNRDHLQPWSPAFHAGLYRESFWRDEAARRQADLQAGLEVRGFLYLHEARGRVVGNLSLTQIARGPIQSCVLGYALAADAQGHGYMLEAVRGAVEYAFGPLGLHRVTANYMPRNRRSGSVLRRAGFVVEGYARDYLLINGRWEDHMLTAIVNREGAR